MKTSEYNLIKLEADDNKVFDYADLSIHTQEIENPETGEKEIKVDHLYAKTIYLGATDSADNYVEIDESEMVEIEHPEMTMEE